MKMKIIKMKIIKGIVSLVFKYFFLKNPILLKNLTLYLNDKLLCNLFKFKTNLTKVYKY